MRSNALFSHLLLFVFAAGAEAVTISGHVVGENGEPLRGARVQLVQVTLENCCHDETGTVASDGSYQFEAPPGLYAIRVGGQTPYYPRTIRIDARSGNRSGIGIQLSRQPRRYVPDEPPRALKITPSTPGETGQTVIRGSAGAVTPDSFVILVNTDTGDVAFTQAGADGSFEGMLFAPAGTAILVESDPYGDTMRNIAVQAMVQTRGVDPFLQGASNESNVDFNIGPLAPLPGTYVDVPLPPAEGGRVAFGGGGGPQGSGMSGLPTWTVRGSMNSDRLTAGQTLELTGSISVTSPSLAGIEKIGANAFLVLEKLAFSDGRPALAHNVQVSSLLTPTGLGIMHTMFGGSQYARGTMFEISRVAANRAEGSFTLQLNLPPSIAAGHYRGLLSFGFTGYPTETASRPQLLLDSSNREGPNVISLPPIRIGAPAEPRLYWTLLTDTLREGTRGSLPLEDAECCAITAIVQSPSRYLVIPRVDEATATPLVYRIEPFAPMIVSGDRGITPPPPAIRFRFPSGHLTARVERPDGGVETIGPVPFVQPRVAGPIDRHGRVPDPGGLSLHHPYQLSTLDPRFEVTFPIEGPYRIVLEGAIEDLSGRTWRGRGTYEIQVGRTLMIDSATLPGTPFEAGNALTPTVTMVPPLPAQIEVRTQLYHGNARVIDRTTALQANRFGAAVGDAVLFDQPGEYRVDVSASHRDGQGRWWFGSRTWGGVVATPNTPVITHGRRGIDDQPADQQRAWYMRSQTTSKLGSGHVQLPFHSGDVTWNQEGDAHVPRVTFDDRDGSVFALLGIAREGPAAIGEAPLFLAASDGNDPHFDPSRVHAWTYAYRSIQRPAVRIREQITDSTFLPSLYWRFSDQYGQQSGNGRNGDRPNDFKFQFASVVIRGAAVPQPHYSIYGSFFVLVPNDDPGGGTRTFPPFRGNGGGPDGGPLFALKGRDINLFFHPTALRPGTVLHRGERISFAGYSAPTLPSKIEVVVTSPSGAARTIRGQASNIGYFYDPAGDFIADESGLWKAKVKILFDGRTSAGQVTAPFPTGDVLGSREGEFWFYVVDAHAPPLSVAASSPTLTASRAGVRFVRPAAEPVTFTITPPAGLTSVEMHTTTTMPGFILEEAHSVLSTQSSALSYIYDAQKLAKDFPNLDLHDADGFAGVDTITISFLLSGTDSTGARKHFARQVVLQGEELLMPEQKETVLLPRRRSVRH